MWQKGWAPRPLERKITFDFQLHLWFVAHTEDLTFGLGEAPIFQNRWIFGQFPKQRGGGGFICFPKIYIEAIFDHEWTVAKCAKHTNVNVSPKNCNISSLKKEGGLSRAVWKFSKESSVMGNWLSLTDIPTKREALKKWYIEPKSWALRHPDMRPYIYLQTISWMTPIYKYMLITTITQQQQLTVCEKFLCVVVAAKAKVSLGQTNHKLLVVALQIIIAIMSFFISTIFIVILMIFWHLNLVWWSFWKMTWCSCWAIQFWRQR